MTDQSSQVKSGPARFLWRNNLHLVTYFGVGILEELGKDLAETLELLATEHSVGLHHVLEIDETVASIGPLRTRQTGYGFVHVLVGRRRVLVVRFLFRTS